MERILLGLGSNVGERLQFLDAALREVDQLPRTGILRVSSIYETAPFGVREQPDFLNAAAEIESTLGPDQLHAQLKEIERKLGRSSSMPWGPREIDLDLLFYGSRMIMLPSLTIPHPGVGKRRFVLVPLAEIAPEFRDPESGLQISELLDRCSDQGWVRKAGSAAFQPMKEH